MSEAKIWRNRLAVQNFKIVINGPIPNAQINLTWEAIVRIMKMVNIRKRKVSIRQRAEMMTILQLIYRMMSKVTKKHIQDQIKETITLATLIILTARRV